MVHYHVYGVISTGEKDTRLGSAKDTEEKAVEVASYFIGAYDELFVMAVDDVTGERKEVWRNSNARSAPPGGPTDASQCNGS